MPSATPLRAHCEALAAGHTLITANRRLAVWLRHDYDVEQLKRGAVAWHAPALHAFADWAEASWRQASAEQTAPELLLSPEQEQVVWEQVIGDDGESGALLDVGGTAANAARAWSLLHAWKLDLRDSGWQDAADSAAFQGWARTFDQRCREAGWLTAAEAPGRLAAAVIAGAFAPPRVVRLAGFDEFTPQQRGLIEACRGVGADCAELAGPAHLAAVVLESHAGNEEEIAACARWARGALEAGATGPIGVVVPALAERREAVERIFAATLHPELPAWRREEARLFNVSLGEALGAAPVAAAALDVLELAVAATPEFAAWSRMLRCPHLGDAAETGARASLDAKLRRRERTRLDLGALAAETARTCPQLAARLRRLGELLRAAPARAPYSAWARHFSAWLQAVGWPGEAPGSGEFQTAAAWQELLDGLATLDLVAPAPRTALEASERLQAMARGRLFQAQSNPAAPVQILGWLEAAGLSFERLSIMGLDEATLPVGSAPHPFLPFSMQREAQMPRSSAARESAFARRRLEALLASAPAVRLSYARAGGAGAVRLGPSPLLEGRLASDFPPLEPAPPALAATERLVDVLAPVAGPDECRVGTGVLSDQAQCPFRAFAHQRLGARGVEAAAFGVSARKRGSLLHTALSTVWSELGDRAGLVRMAEEPLRALCERAVGEAVAADADLRLPTAAAAPLLAHLGQVIEGWLECERERSDFAVLEREQPRELDLGGLTVAMKLDRLDQLPDGRLVVLDYKSGGDHKVSAWLGPRPEDPQLPLYALTLGAGALGALAWATLEPGHMKFVGLAATAVLPGVKAGTLDADRIETWRAELTEVAEAYRTGEAAVEPKSPKTCERCDLAAVCRIHEHRAIGGAEEDGDA